MDWRSIGYPGAVLCLLATAGTAGAQSLATPNVYYGGNTVSQDSILDSANGYPVSPGRAAVLAAETTVSLTASVMHTQYHENFPGGNGDDENGVTPGFSVGASALLPLPVMPFHTDLYTSIGYQFSAGNITYNGHYQDGTPTDAIDNAVFNRIEARIGMGFPLRGGAEVIPFLAGGYQSWNRNINQKHAIGSDEFYHSGMAGGGVKLDIPLTPQLVASATGEFLGLVGGGIALNGTGVTQKFGPSAEELITLGLDYRIHGRFHIVGSAFWENFNYSGSQPQDYVIGDGYYQVNEPLSVTRQFGANLGIAYSY
jgi:hypothetical protein